jgi:tRNA (cytidine56-2'-O)-methyltransferase
VVKEIVVLRYGHRTVRDYRVTSHCSLVARAFGAKKIIVCGEKDESMRKSVDDITSRWGGPFSVEFVDEWNPAIKKLQKKGFVIVHLTMYGEKVQKVDKKISTKEKVCVIIGSQKVEKEVYEIADYNVSITNQPHSEIAALAVLLDRIQKGKQFDKKFIKAKTHILPQKVGKKVINLK